MVQSARVHPLLPVLLLLSTSDKQDVFLWPGACPRHAGSSLPPKTSLAATKQHHLVYQAVKILLDQCHPVRKTGTGLPVLWHRSLCNPLALAHAFPSITKPLQDSLGSLLNIGKVSCLLLSSHFSPGSGLPASGSSQLHSFCILRQFEFCSGR